jgi:uncharacterized protein (TIGR02611 family)
MTTDPAPDPAATEAEPTGPAAPAATARATGRDRTEAEKVADKAARTAERDERRALFREAAYQAERATGREEKTEEEARRNIFLRLGIIFVGFAVLFGGLAMMILPGPGILGIIAGLGILSKELPWAERLLEYAKEKAKLDELKKQPAWVKVVMWVGTIAAAGAGVTYAVVR